MERYNMVKLNSHFFVTDSRSSQLVALNTQGQHANIATEPQFFQLTFEQAVALEAQLNAR